MQDKTISNKQISLLTSEKKYSDAAKLLLEEQKKSWPLCASGYEALKAAKVKEFIFDNFTIRVQLNPKRIISSAANVDEESIKQRKCFLCIENLPEEQKGILINNFIILCNPYPIAPEHFTISYINHEPQRITNNFATFLSLTKDLSKNYTLFYNGPKCGASAPDHLHFQAIKKFFMPIDNEFFKLRNQHGKFLIEQVNIIVSAVDDGLRRFIAIESSSEEILIKQFKKIYQLLSSFSADQDEPMMNIHSSYEEEIGWRMLVFPRAKHRPSHYFKTGDEQILLSVASVDLGGVCILPLEKDFNKITKNNIVEIFNEVMFDKQKFDQIAEQIKNTT